jgi:hypothetical protein
MKNVAPEMGNNLECECDPANIPVRKKRRILARALLYGLPLLVLGMIAWPNFGRFRSVACLNSCINNLRRIDGAKEQWALENMQHQ